MQTYTVAVIVLACSMPEIGIPDKGNQKAVTKMIIAVPFGTIATTAPEDTVKSCSETLQNMKQPTDAVATALEKRGTANCLLCRFDAAFNDFDALCKLKPEEGFPRALRAEALGCLGRTEDAIVDVREAVRLDPKVAFSHALLANLLHLQGKPSEALDCVSRALEIDENLAEAYFVHALIAGRQADGKRALSCIDRYLEMRPFPPLPNPELPYQMRGNALLRLGRTRDALSNFAMARTLSPLSSDCLLSILHVYEFVKKWDMAAKASEELPKLNPKAPLGYLKCAYYHARSGNQEAARSWLKRADALSPFGANPFNDGIAGGIYYYLGDYSKADEILAEALRADPTCQSANWGRAAMLATCPDPKYRDGCEAVTLAHRIHEREKELAKADTFFGELYLLLADAHAECGEFVEANNFIESALKLAGADHEKSDLVSRVTLFQQKKAYRMVIPRK